MEQGLGWSDSQLLEFAELLADAPTPLGEGLAGEVATSNTVESSPYVICVLTY